MTTPTLTFTWRRLFVVAAAGFALVLALVAPNAAAAGGHAQRADVLTQDEHSRHGYPT